MQMVLELKGVELDTLAHSFDRRSRTLEYLSDANGCFVPGDVSKHPWFVDLLAAQYTGKYVHTLRLAPSVNNVRSDISSFIHKVKWRSLLSADETGEK